ncbi:hypothetical protein SAMN02746041_00831 [Desulfacinum hydrothermale DSM 13146]|uniref:Fibronectin type-III domain-containing protein n=1 Tax=Desulfacinum hydrothermale DSM 13146 TaxID=1121390 RepID=A0A1W1X831_9BACT|nr:fibronectin type III domain-containing protein [Desulfacinum hydrothermale]SMC20135.1 hypothetical protein SAMN02746041_00831 [Desulfacinum hydrothermale DSM 13146]
MKRLSHPARKAYTFAALCLAMIMTLSACGKKTPPKPLSPEAPACVTKIEADVEGRTVQLRWEIPERIRGATPGDYTFVVQREITEQTDAQCAECPPVDTVPVVRIDPAATGPWKVEGHTITWKDSLSEDVPALRYWVGILGPNDSLVSLSPPVRILMGHAPPAVSRLQATTEPRGIFLHWDIASSQKAPSDAASHSLRIERRMKDGSWAPLTEETSPGNGFLDTKVVPEKTYEYRVRPFRTLLDARIWGPWAESGPVRAPRKITPPPPESVWAIPTEQALEVYWTESLVPVRGYHVYRKDDKGITRLTVQPVAAPPYVDTQAKANHVYFYAVSAVSVDAPYREGLLSRWFEVRNVRFK